ncbi:hypothetical protein CMV_026621 [Castanea mollissima]|uniref:Leucine-rich repeat-containing N-terminal plant-type domain-containing protein n=1 Tax=Castanea mollissima TaxID=60419 RepID=A0A8J4QGW7_9ROSI|nr:hypothetical protein CMV_026621 [Castanea mollissima]
MRWFIWLSQLFYLLLLFYSQLASSSSSSFNSSSPLLCSQDQSSALLQFKQLFSPSEYGSYYCNISYPKMESWKEGTDCCSWDGVTCDSVRGDVIGLDLSCSRLYGTIPSNASLFDLPHLQRLNLAFNDFNYSQISSGFGRFAKNLSSSLASLTLEGCRLRGSLPDLDIFGLQNLRELNLRSLQD